MVLGSTDLDLTGYGSCKTSFFLGFPSQRILEQMLKVGDKSHIELSVEHLLAPTPTNLQEVLERYNDMKIVLLHHIVSSPDCNYESKFGRGRIPSEISSMSANDRFKRVLSGRVINGNPKSYFVNKHKKSLDASQIEALKSVSFTMCSDSELPRHFKARGSEYGICFFHDFLQENGIRPVLYLNDEDELGKQRMIFNSPYLVEICSKGYDMRWENEWRIRQELSFNSADVAFVIVPDDEYGAMVDWLVSERLDYLAIPSSIFNNRLNYLRKLPELEHASWSQIRLFEGLLVDFHEFKEPTFDDREKMIANAGLYLDCLAKADLMGIYEHRFIDRFVQFIGSLDASVCQQNSLLRRHATIIANSEEPWGSSRDLTIAAFEELFKIQEKRITKNWV